MAGVFTIRMVQLFSTIYGSKTILLPMVVVYFIAEMRRTQTSFLVITSLKEQMPEVRQSTIKVVLN
ncbi:hypothetical protein D3C86_785540 [compost metagenome]